MIKRNEFKIFIAMDTIEEYGIKANIKTKMDNTLVTIESGAVYSKYSNIESLPLDTINIAQTTLATFYLYDNGSLNITAINSNDIAIVTNIINLFISSFK